MTHSNKLNNKPKPKYPTQFIFEAIGTNWQIDINTNLSPNEYTGLNTVIQKRIEEFDHTYSRFRRDSIVTAMAAKKGEYLLPEDAKKLVSLYKQLYDLTEGAFTPLIGQVLVDAGYDAAYSLHSKKLTIPAKWEEILMYEYPSIKLQKPALLDFGAAGKGYLIDLLGTVLCQQHIASFCIDAGGDMLYKNTMHQPLRVGLEHPENLNQVIGVVTITNQSICGSAGNRRKWGTYHHIMNPQTLNPTTDILATWVIADEAILADALATCLFFVPPARLKDYFKFEHLTLYPDYSFEKSSGFSAELFTT